MGNGRKGVGTQLGFLLLISTIWLSLVMGGSSIREHRKNEQMKWHISQQGPSISRARSLSDSKQNSLNSTRSARQTPEIPALYSVPKIPTPEIPALYSAPEINPESQKEVDSSADQGRATTEVSVEEMDEEEEETSSDDYQYGVPTEKDPNSNESSQEEEHPTDSPSSATPRTNEDDSTEDSYGMGRDSKEPSSEYGPPTAKEPSPEYGLPGSKEPKSQYLPPSPSQGRSPAGQGKEGSGESNPPTDQQQMENTMQPMSQTEHYNDEDEHGAAEGDQSSFYLPPVHTNQVEQPQQQHSQDDNKQGANSHSQYDGNFDQYQQPPNPNYKTLPPESNGGDVHSYPASGGGGGYPAQNFESRPHDLNNQRSSAFPQQQPQTEGQAQQPHQQGQDFGKGTSSKPSSLYGPPGVNHLGSQNLEDELEGLNEKIVDAEMLQRVHQIIEDHENQQKLLLEGIQKNNEKGSSFGYSTGSHSSPSQEYSGNELNGPTGFSSPGSSYSTGYSGNGGAPSTFYGPPSFSSTSSDSNSLYQQGNPNGNRAGTSQSPQPSEAYKGVGGSGGADSSRRDSNRSVSSSPSSQAAPGYNSSGRQEGNDNEPRNSSPNVEYQKAILSTHFTETEPAPQSQYRGNSNGNAASGYPNSNNQLNSFAGPGQEYLPPADSGKQGGNNMQNEGYARTFSSGDYAAQAQNQNNGGGNTRERNSYSVKLGAGIMVGDDRQAPKSSSVSPGYLPPAGSQASSTRQQQGHADSGNFYTRPEESSQLSPARSQPQQQQQQQHPYFPSFQSPGNDPTFWSRNQVASEPQTRYGPPLTGASKTTFRPLGATDNNNNGGNSLSAYGTGFGAQNQIKYSSGLGVESPAGNNNDNSQRSQSPQQLYPVPQPQHTTTAPTLGSGNAMSVSVPRPVYGVPLAPVITLDSSGYSLAGSDGSSTPYSFDRGQAGGQAATPNANYLPPSSSTQYNSAPVHSPSIGQDLSNSFHSQSPSSPNEAIYGILSNNPSSSASSTYLSIQGLNGNSNNHIYNINHNGYGGSSVSSGSSSSNAGSLVLAHPPSNGDYYDSSSIIPGLSNPFALPIYDYSPDATHQLLQNDLRVGASTSTSTVVVPLEQFLEQLPLAHNMPSLSAMDLPAIIYGSQDQGFRLARRAVSKQASVSSVSNPNQKQLSRTAAPPPRASNSGIKNKSPRG